MTWMDRFRNRKSSKHENSLLYYQQSELPGNLYAIVRISWFRKGIICGVTESKIDCDDIDVVLEFTDIVGDALRVGADVSVICIDDPINLGIYAT